MNYSIPEPCTESFEEMRPVSGGRHCERCVRRIMDLTAISDDDLRHVFLASEGKICGMFDADQLERLNRTHSVKSAMPAWYKAAAAIAALTFVAGSLSAQQPADVRPIRANEARCEVETRNAHVHEAQEAETSPEEQVKPVRLYAKKHESYRDWRKNKDIPLRSIHLTILTETGSEVLWEGKLKSEDGNFEIPTSELKILPEVVLFQVRKGNNTLSRIVDISTGGIHEFEFVKYINRGKRPRRTLGIPIRHNEF